MKIATRILEFAIAAVLLAFLTTISYNLMKKALKVQDAALEQTLVVGSAIDSSAISMFEDNWIAGTQVIQQVNKFTGVYPVMIATADVPGGFYTSVGINDPNSKHYVSGNLMFLGGAYKDENGKILALSFTQEGVTRPDYDAAAASSVAEAIQMDNDLAVAQFRLSNFRYEHRDVFEQIRELRQEITDVQDKTLVLDAQSTFDALEHDLTITDENNSMSEVYRQMMQLEAQIAERQKTIDRYQALLDEGDVSKYPVYEQE